MIRLWPLALLLVTVTSRTSHTSHTTTLPPAGVAGYYRYPALHGDTLIFTAHGDLYRVTAKGGEAQPLTTHPGEETRTAISPDGKWVAFTATYEGPSEAYVMPVDGGVPDRLSFGGETTNVTGWTPDGKVLCATGRYSTLPDYQLIAIEPKTHAQTKIPLAQAADGCYDASGDLYFTRLPFQGSHTKRYKGGEAQNLWKLAPAAKEAVLLTGAYVGTSKQPMWWNGRVYFVSDRDGTMNLWSMKPDGGDLKQHTKHAGFDVQSPSMDGGRIAYQLGADIWIYDAAANTDKKVDITLASDLDQMREKWITKPLEYLTAAHLSPDGDRVALTARGQVFVAPAKQGRLVEATRKGGVRYRHARFAPDGKSLYALSDESGEAEWWELPANGIGARAQVGSGSKVLNLDGVVSPDGKYIVYANKDWEVWLLNVKAKQATKIATTPFGDVKNFVWSPDSRWLAYVLPTQTFDRIALYSVRDGKTTLATSDRFDSAAPAWSADGKWLYFLSSRSFKSVVDSPWGPRAPEPFFDKTTRIYALALQKGQRSPFQPGDELHPEKDEKPAEKTPPVLGAGGPAVDIDLDGLQTRQFDVPAAPGNYDELSATATRLIWLSHEAGNEQTGTLMAMDIARHDAAPKTLADGVAKYELSLDRKKLLMLKGGASGVGAVYVIDSGAPTPAPLEKAAVDLSGWSFALQPREEWRQMFVEAWRLERDYFYDPALHGVDWPAVRRRYEPLVERVTDRSELSDLIAQVVGELSALHTFVVGGDVRKGDESVFPAALGAVLARDEAQGGYRIERIYQSDPDFPDAVAPLAHPDVDAGVGDVIQAINGVDLMTVPDPAVLLRNQANRQMLVKIKNGPPAPNGGAATGMHTPGAVREAIVVPFALARARNLRYDDWELSRRQLVEAAGKGDIGYVHLRAMGTTDIAQWARDFYPVFNRQGLIIDVRHNGGGNIDSWILEKLLRRAWFYWQPRVGNPYWNMQWAFRGHAVVLCDSKTGSDGEAFSEGFKRLGIGKVFGTRTWGGEVWLTMSNRLVDSGIASAAEFGVYGPEGAWLIEGHGVDPDVVVDNLPKATYEGEDAQLQAAIAYLQKQIQEHPVAIPKMPKRPNKSFKLPDAPPGE